MPERAPGMLCPVGSRGFPCRSRAMVALAALSGYDTFMRWYFYICIYIYAILCVYKYIYIYIYIYIHIHIHIFICIYIYMVVYV